ncbi:MAG: lytic murein transglycosylase [Deltaproteobacteria bacterium]|nr:lytic murein transglycosylase [Deltaproteobacteria bacterium]
MKDNMLTRYWRLAALPVLFLLASCSHTAPVVPTPRQALPAQPIFENLRPDPRMFVEDMLVSKGHKRSEVHALLADQRVKINAGVMVTNMFYAKPAPSKKNGKVMAFDQKYIGLGLEFMDDHSDAYYEACERYKVSPEVITAILIIESQLGKYPMKYSVFNVYASLTTLLDSEYLNATLQERKEKHTLTEDNITAARKKGNWGLGELSAFIKLSENLGVDPLTIYGSYAGALGWAQFIPTSFLKFGVDGDNDGKVDPFNMDDCIVSVANYLKLAGWKEDAADERKRKAIWAYNHHDVYVNTIMLLRDELIAAGEEKENQEVPEEGEEASPGEVKPEDRTSSGTEARAGEKILNIPTSGNGSVSGRPDNTQ